MTSSLKSMDKKLIRRQLCVLLKLLQLITVTRSVCLDQLQMYTYLFLLQITKQIVKANGETVFTAALTTTNEKAEIRVLAFVATKSHAQFESALVKMRQSLHLYGHLQPKIVYTDNPAADKQFLEHVFDFLHEDVVPVDKHATLKALVRPEDVNISLQSSASGIESGLAKIVDDLSIEDETSHVVVGFDAEWNVDLTTRGAAQPTAIIQIAYGKWINIFQVELNSCNID